MEPKEQVLAYIQARGLPLQPRYTGEDTSTVSKAAAVMGVEDGQIAKSLSLRLPEGVAVLVTMGTARLHNQKYKAAFRCKAKMLKAEETQAETGFPVGGVCPFGLPEGVVVYLDESLKAYEVVYPAAGTRDSAVAVPVAKLAEYTGGRWVDVCQE